MEDRKVKIKIIKPHQGMPYFKVSCPCCPRFLETEQRHRVAMFLAYLHIEQKHPKPWSWVIDPSAFIGQTVTISNHSDTEFGRWLQRSLRTGEVVIQ